MRQVEDIELIRDTEGLMSLPEGLREVAELRLQYPEATLQELAEFLPGVGRSGINHRFRRIAKIASELKQ
jgi:DNA-binding protein WhiA